MKNKQEKENGLTALNIYSNSDSLSSSKTIKPFAMYFNLCEIHNKAELKSRESDILSKLTSLTDTTRYAGIFYIASYFKLSELLHYTKDQKIEWLNLLEKQNKITSSYGYIEVEQVKNYLQFVLNYEYYKLNEKTAKEVINTTLSESQIANIDMFGFFELDERFIDFFKTNQGIISKEIKKSNKEVLVSAVQLVSAFPRHKNLAWLKKIYSLDESFSDFWMKHSQTNWIKLPQNERITDYLNQSDTAEWIVLDVWATWCKPCIKELPELNEMSRKFKENPNWKATFLTFSYNSTELKEFMEKNNYTFPVLEIGKRELKDMEIRVFPTTFLINSNEKYIALPSGEHKEEILQVLMLKNW